MQRIVLVLACLGVLALTPAATAAPQAKVAVVDMLKLINRHPDTKKLRELLKKKEQEAQDFARRSKERLEKLRKEIETLPAGDVKRRLKQAQFEKQAWTNEYDFKFMVQEARHTYVRELESTHAAVRALVAKYARDNGIQLVIQMTGDQLNAQDRNDFVMKVALRSVVWFDSALDITAEVEKTFGQ